MKHSSVSTRHWLLRKTGAMDGAGVVGAGVGQWGPAKQAICSSQKQGNSSSQ